MKLAKLPWFWLGLLGAGFFMYTLKGQVEAGSIGTPTADETVLRIHWKADYDKDWYGDGVVARDEALESVGVQYRSLGIIGGVEQLAIKVVNKIQAEGIKGMLEMHEAVAGVEVL